MNRKSTSIKGELSPPQHDAIRLLVSGCTAKYTALVLKVDYADVKRWMNQDSLFQSELASAVEKHQTQSSELANASQEMRLNDEKNRRRDSEGEEMPRELASS